MYVYMYIYIPSGQREQKANMAIEIVDWPMKHGDFPF